MDVRKTVCLLWWLSLIQIGSGLAQIPAISYSDSGWVDVTGLNPVILSALKQHDWGDKEWQTILKVNTEQSYRTTPDLAIWGHYRLHRQGIRFTPRYPFVPGEIYRVSFRYGDLARIPSEVVALPVPDSLREMHYTFRVAEAPAAETRLTAVFPTADTLPANQLKWYLQFSGPMSEREAYRHVHLLDESGREVRDAFLILDQEMWDASRSRLTLLFDPGRIKRGLRPNREAGAPLVEGRSYTLRVDSTWRDGSGRSLAGSVEKRFHVGAPDRKKPDYRQWRLSQPVKSSQEPLLVRFDEPLDWVLAGRLIQLQDEKGNAVPGKVALTDQEMVWRFTPSTPWSGGSYSLLIHSRLEDRAGNNLTNLFDVDRRQERIRPQEAIFRRTVDTTEPID